MAQSKYAVGTKHMTNQGELVVLELINAEKGVKGKSNKRAIVRFTATGYITNVQISNIPTNKVKDQRLPSVYGIGYLDGIVIPQRGTYVRRVYDLWANMLKRVTSEAGYEDVTVDTRWHSFRNFLNTITMIQGYEKWEANESVQLDKDTLVVGNRTYTADRCAFIPTSENLTDASNRRWARK